MAAAAVTATTTGHIIQPFLAKNLARESIFERIHSVNEKINAFVKLVKPEEFVNSRNDDEGGRLNGVTVGVKDNIHLSGYASSCASAMLKGFIPDWNAAAVEALKREGSIILGKTNMDEFGMGSHSTRSIFGSVINPIVLKDDKVRLSAGGSSGGSAAAVSAGLCQLALGSDTGGSVRLPASYCGVIGFKPSYGRISRHGLVTYASSLDTIGFTVDSMDLAILAFKILKTTGGYKDMTSAPRISPIRRKKLSDCTVVVPREITEAGWLEPAARENLKLALEYLSNAGAKIISLSIESLQYALATYYVSVMVEASSCLARFPSIHFPSGTDEEQLGPHVRNRIRLGKWISSHRHYKDFYQKAITRRSNLKSEFEKIFLMADLVVTPTSIGPPPSLTSLIDDPNSSLWKESNWERVLASDFSNAHLDELIADVLTVPASLVRLPAISLPIHLSDVCGVQLMAAQDRDEELLLFAKELMDISSSSSNNKGKVSL